MHRVRVPEEVEAERNDSCAQRPERLADTRDAVFNQRRGGLDELFDDTEGQPANARVHRRLDALIRFDQDLEQDRRVLDRSREHPDGVVRPGERDDAGGRHTPERRPDPDEAAQRGRHADRPARIRS